MWLVIYTCLIAYILLAFFLHLSFSRRKYDTVKTMVVLGSGGHTSEMLKLLGFMDLHFYSPRIYIIATSDSHSATKAQKFEQHESGTSKKCEKKCEVRFLGNSVITLEKFHRSREVGQSFLTSFFTTLLAILQSFHIIIRHKPDLVLINGPGTCIPICGMSKLLSWLGLMRTRVIYIESIARVQRLSLTGKLVYHLHLTDLFFVQWPQLIETYPKSEFLGRLY